MYLKTAVLAITLATSNAALGQPFYRGGSNYMWYAPDGWNSKSYWEYNIIRNYDKMSAWPFGPGNPVSVSWNVDYQLTRMYSEQGQRRLRIGIYHARVAPNDPEVSTFNCEGQSEYFGSLLNSYYNGTPGELSPRCWNNFTSFLTAVRDKGFEEVLLSFFPSVGNDPSNWNTFNADLYAENRQLILNARQRLISIGIPYRIDVGNEMTPGSGSPQGLKDYTRTLWTNFPYKWETVGFSINCDTVTNCRDRIAQMPAMYSSNYPPVLSPHIGVNYYPNDVQNVYLQAWYKLRDLGLGGTPWIIGEATYNDASEASDLTSVQQGLGNTVYYLTQWPGAFPSGDRNPPIYYNNYYAYGW